MSCPYPDLFQKDVTFSVCLMSLSLSSPLWVKVPSSYSSVAAAIPIPLFSLRLSVCLFVAKVSAADEAITHSFISRSLSSCCSLLWGGSCAARACNLCCRRPSAMRRTRRVCRLPKYRFASEHSCYMLSIGVPAHLSCSL